MWQAIDCLLVDCGGAIENIVKMFFPTLQDLPFVSDEMLTFASFRGVEPVENCRP